VCVQVSILAEMKHDHIVKFHDFYAEPTRYLIVMEVCDGGELLHRIVQKVRATSWEG
jgi:serine/threonine protein kinase